jgi:HAD superfamily hydrolase (TIGR01549 family)
MDRILENPKQNEKKAIRHPFVLVKFRHILQPRSSNQDMPLDIAQIQALCFDVDGTLLDTDDQYAARISRLLTPLFKLARRRDERRVARRIVMILDTPINAVYTLLDWMHLDGSVITALERYQDWSLRRSKHVHPLIPGTLPSLEVLGKRYPLAVVTARGKQGTDKFLAHYQLQDRFVCVASGQTTRHTKPWPDPVLWCAEQIGVPPESCLMIGDTTVDVHSGKSAGAQAVGVLSGFGDERELTRAGADLVVEDVAALTGFIEAHFSPKS